MQFCRDLKKALVRDTFEKLHQLDAAHLNAHGDTDVRRGLPGSSSSNMSLPFPFSAPDHTPCTEIKAGINSHPRIPYRMIPLLDLPRFSYEDLPPGTFTEAQLRTDPRLLARTRRRTSSASAGESPRGTTEMMMMSPVLGSPPMRTPNVDEDPRTAPRGSSGGGDTPGGSASPRIPTMVANDPRRRQARLATAVAKNIDNRCDDEKKNCRVGATSWYNCIADDSWIPKNAGH